MNILLTHSPLDDPTIPYHSNAYLAGHLVHSGFDDVVMRDTNVEFFNWCLEREVLERYSREAEARLRELEGKEALSFTEQEEYLGFWSQPELACQEVADAVTLLRGGDKFFDFDAYQEAVAALNSYFCILAALSYPSDIGNFRQATRGRYSQYHLRDLFDPKLGRQICRPFLEYLDAKMGDDPGFQKADCIGLSIVYEHQMFHAIQFARWLKQRWPDKQILLGGTSVSQLYKYLTDKDEMKRFFGFVDGIVAGEGETAICQIAGAGGVTPGMQVQNLITYDASRDRVHLPERVHYETVPALGRPIYPHDWDLYLTPERGINYSPTRGCYWNKCTFCDYGLNTSMPTSPWRERTVEQVISDLRYAVDESGVRFVYFAVDVMSPKYMDRLSDALVDAGLGLRWGAEIRMERVFSPERCRKIQESGCVHVSFGMESGNQRILDLIDKGTRVEYMGETMKNFFEAGVAVHLFTFTDFPTETPEEKEESKQFIRDHEPWWSGGGLGTFLLTGTAIIARDPSRFGVELVKTKDADISRALAFELEKDKKENAEKGEKSNGHEVGQEEEEKAPRLTSVSAEDADASFDDDGGVFPGVLGRPWAGSTDCLHTMIYYEVYGPEFFRLNPVEVVHSPGPESDEAFLESKLVIPGLVRESAFDVGRIVQQRAAFTKHLGDLYQVPEEPTLAKFEAWCQEREPLERAEGQETYWIRSGERLVALDKLIFRLLRVGAASSLPIGQLFEAYPEPLRPRLIAYLRLLGKSALIEFHNPNEVQPKPAPLRRIPLPERDSTQSYPPQAEPRVAVPMLADETAGRLSLTVIS